MEHTPPHPEHEPSFLPVNELAPTGISQLDVVLGGGMPQGALAILVGPPGSGKTTLASQIIFTAAARGEQALILTSFSEPTIKLVAHLRGYRFFEPDLLGSTVQILSLVQFLSSGWDTTEREIVAVARKFRARWVVLDGFQAFRTLAPDQRPLRSGLYRLGTRLSLEGVTTLITTEAQPRDVQLFPEMTTGDVLLGLYFDLNGVRAERGLEVIKVRGNAPVPGRHSMSIDAEGVSVFPRLETRILRTTAGTVLPEHSTRQPGQSERAAFGLEDVDAVLAGGLTRQTSTLLAGSLGAGKTLLALYFALTGISNNEPTVWLSFRETEEQLLEQAESFGIGERLRAALAGKDRLHFRHLDPVEMDPDQIAHDLLRILEQSGAQRLVIDSIAEITRAVDESAHPRRVPNYLAALLAALRVRGVTLLAIKETPETLGATLDVTMDEASVLAENVLMVQQTFTEEEVLRRFWVLKTRFSAHASRSRRLVLVPSEGIRLLPDDSSRQDLGRQASKPERRRGHARTSSFEEDLRTEEQI